LNDYLNSDKHDWQLGLLSQKKSHVSHYIIFITACAKKCPPPARTQARRRWSHLPKARSMTAWRGTAHSLWMRRFS